MISALPSSRSASGSLGWFALIVVVAGLAAWWGVWNGAYLFDDHPAIEQNEALLGELEEREAEVRRLAVETRVKENRSREIEQEL